MLLALLAAVAVKAAVSQVTIYSDRARVVRTGEVAVAGPTRAELPLLPDTVDVGSIRLEATGAEVHKLDIAHVEPDEFPLTEARELLGKLEKLDDQLFKAADEQNELEQHLKAIRSIAPAVKDEPLKPRPRLNPKSWGDALAFAQDQEQVVKTRLRDGALKSDELRRERQVLADKARLIGGAGRRSGYRVTATLDGQGTAHLTLTYLAAQARWTPGYDLQLLQDQKTVRVSFSGALSQETGEDWDASAMTLSTAIPATVRALPEIATWKIGEKERFIPTPIRGDRPPPRPPPPMPPGPPRPLESAPDQLRRQLLERAAQAQPVAAKESAADEEESAVEGVVGRAAAAPQQAPKREPMPMMRAAPLVASAPPSVGQMPKPAMVASAPPPREPQGEQVGIAPPPAWQPPWMPPESPAALAGGYDLEFPSLRRESVHSGKGARRVLLFSETWPVVTERLIEPALSPDAYLVAQIKNPSRRTLPRGQAALAVGADPAGAAEVPLVAPGQEFTLPLGIDRALRPIRNVAQVQSEKGLFSKDEVTRYATTIELANPYPAPLPLRIVDQLPLPGDKNVEVELIEAQGAAREEGTGKLTWRLTAPASGKVKVGFLYELKRPKGYKVHQ
jgi:hypothetical protein